MIVQAGQQAAIQGCATHAVVSLAVRLRKLSSVLPNEIPSERIVRMKNASRIA